MQRIANTSITKTNPWESQFPAFNRAGINTSHRSQEDYDNLQEDTIEISENAKKLAIYNKNESGEDLSTDAVSQNAAGGEMSEGDQAIQKLREQIQEIQQKIQEAQQRLIKAQSSDDSQKKKDVDPNEAALQDAVAMLTESTEVESIRAEIEMLNQQLMMLNDQLKEAMQGKA